MIVRVADVIVLQYGSMVHLHLDEGLPGGGLAPVRQFQVAEDIPEATGIGSFPRDLVLRSHQLQDGRATVSEFHLNTLLEHVLEPQQSLAIIA